MRSSSTIVVLAILLLTACAHKSKEAHSQLEQSSSVQQAVLAANILPTDPFEEKVKKALTLINQERYYYPKGPQPKLDPPFDQPYHLDSLRTPEQILNQKIGGYCGSAALVFAAILRKAGVKNEDMQIVLAVNAPDLEIICPVAGQLRVENPKTGASGHVFVALKFPDGQWRLINTIDGSNYESIEWMPPESLAAQMKKSPVQIPFSIYKKFPFELRSLPMVVFRSWAPDEVPLHTFDQRLDLIASGEMADPKTSDNSKAAKICRYGASAMNKLKKPDLIYAYVLGTIHGNMLNQPKNNLRGFVGALYSFKPTLILNEVRPEFPNAIDGTIDGGPEQALVYAYASQNKTKVIPVDWFDDQYNIESDRENQNMSATLKQEIAPLFEKFRKTVQTGTFIESQSSETQDLIRERYVLLEKNGLRSAARRNEHICKNIQSQASDLRGERVLVIFGLAHKYALEECLRKMEMEPLSIDEWYKPEKRLKISPYFKKSAIHNFVEAKRLLDQRLSKDYYHTGLDNLTDKSSELRLWIKETREL